MTRNSAWSAALLALALLTNRGQSPLFADDLVDDLKGRYGFTNWVGNTEINYACLVTNWVPNFATFGVTNLISTLGGTWVNGSKNSAYFFHPTNRPDATVDLRVQERPSVTDTHNAMMELFGNCSAIQPFPLGTVEVGDRCYLGYPTNVYNSIVFVRNNVLLTVSANQTNCSVRAIVEDLDSQIKAISEGN